ncbi:Kinesin-like protein KIN-UC [Vitis vinifera]|uniref:Vacuolar protein 8 n=1 Tax=Vitis vinifera TaxID=29760 RepID=A0A438DU51_VITVI|nr:Kinesin-like protein KIN-UC [Vitis vinifera]
MGRHQELSVNELQSLQSEYNDLLSEKATLTEELHAVNQTLSVEEKQRKTIENELVKLKKLVLENDHDFEDKKSYVKESIVGLQKILALLTSEDLDVQIHAVKVVANLAAEDINQEKIVEEGGLDALLLLLRSSKSTTILRVASGAIANLAMNELNQGLIISKGGGQLLANMASKTDDPQTLRMVAGAIANLCGNEKLHMMLKEEGGIKALLGMVRSGNSDVIAQVARGVANFAKCESRGIIQASTRRHMELALCHLAQNENNAQDFKSSGGVRELKRIAAESTREDIQNLAKKTLNSTPFQAEIHAEL